MRNSNVQEGDVVSLGVKRSLLSPAIGIYQIGIVSATGRPFLVSIPEQATHDGRSLDLYIRDAHSNDVVQIISLESESESDMRVLRSTRIASMVRNRGEGYVVSLFFVTVRFTPPAVVPNFDMRGIRI